MVFILLIVTVAISAQKKSDFSQYSEYAYSEKIKIFDFSQEL